MDNIDCYEVNLNRVSEDKKTHSVIRLLAVDLQKNPYTSVGDWLQSISDHDLQSLIDDVCEADETDEMGMQSLILGTLMLSRAESVFIESEDQLAHAAEMFRVFIVIASLHRKKMARALFKNMSFGEDASKLPVAEKL